MTWLWRHSWALYETRPNRLTRALFNALDAIRDRLA